MKKSKIFFLLPLLTLGLFISCAKDEKEPIEPPTGGGGGTAPGFTWTPTGGQMIKADQFYYVNAFNNIVAFKNGNSKVVDINLSALNQGTYDLSPSLGNSLEYVSDNYTYTAKSGNVTISSNLNNKLTGKFSAVFSSGTLTGISGQFVDIGPK